MLPTALQKAISNLSPDAQEVIELIVAYYEAEQEKLQAEIQALKDQLSKNSSNSSKPPSSDSPFTERLKARRKQSLRKPGGQEGHEGRTLKMVAEPTHTEVHRLDSCTQCGHCLKEMGIVGHERRQVFDIPPIDMEVSEHQAEMKHCPSCDSVVVADFPADVSSSVQYGPNLKSLLTYWQNYQMLPYARTVEMVRDLTGHTLSAGTLHNTQTKVYNALEDFEQELKELLSKEDLAHFDETGMRISSDLVWVHLCTTPTHAHFATHAKRGHEAMTAIGILPHFQGTAVHDFWKSYFSFGCDHAACNAHLLRELKFIEERYGQDWAANMAGLLIRIKRAVEKAKENGKTQLAKNLRSRFHNQYEKLLQEGFDRNPKPPPTGKRGRTKKSKPLNLLERFDDWESAVLRFMDDFEVPFDNNLAERNLRMLKVKLKVSGCFRSQKGAEYFMRIRSFILTARMQGLAAFQALKELFVKPLDITQRLILGQ